jgi:hypothetical protein
LTNVSQGVFCLNQFDAFCPFSSERIGHAGTYSKDAGTYSKDEKLTFATLIANILKKECSFSVCKEFCWSHF